MKKKTAEAMEATEQLRRICPPGTTIYTSVKHVSRSGMQRTIACYIIAPDKQRGQVIQQVNGWVCRILGLRFDDKRGGCIIGGAGMDMGFHIVNSLSYALHGAPQDHPVGIVKGTGLKPGYTLKHEWL